MTYHFDSIIAANLEGQRSIINQVLQTSPMFDADAVEINNRMIRFNDHWVVDFASCNYLGYDLESEIIESIEPALQQWGVHPSWCRLVASPSLYSEAEEKLADLIGCEDTLILPTVTLIGIGVIPALMGKDGVMFLDKIAHMTMYEAAKMARDSGSTLINFRHKDYDFLEYSLKKHKDNPKKLIMVDGTYSMTGNYAEIDILARLAHEYNAILYVDDAHGFGVVGESPDTDLPYGYKGNGIVKHFAQNYDRILYIGGLSKAYSSLAAFISCDKQMKHFLKAFATPYDLSGPCPTASLQSLITGIALNEKKGDELRKKLYVLTKKTIDNETYFPIVSVWLGNTEYLIATSNILWEAGILVTLSPYPMVKKGDETLRITITAANTEDEVSQLLKAFDMVKEYLVAQNAPLTPQTV